MVILNEDFRAKQILSWCEQLDNSKQCERWRSNFDQIDFTVCFGWSGHALSVKMNVTSNSIWAGQTSYITIVQTLSRQNTLRENILILIVLNMTSVETSEC